MTETEPWGLPEINSVPVRKLRKSNFCRRKRNLVLFYMSRAAEMLEVLLLLQLEVDTAASILHGVKIVQIHNITKKPAKIYVLSLYNFDAM
jgi:hypothetical protein